MTIDFELTKEQFLEQWKKDLAGLRQSPLSWTVFCAALWFTIDNWGKIPWWMSFLEFVVVTHLWWLPKVIVRLVTAIAFWSRSTIQARIEIDNSGIGMQPDTSHPLRVFRWSDFKNMSETKIGIELKFKGSYYGALVPWIAFRDAAQQTEFLRILNSHLAVVGGCGWD